MTYYEKNYEALNEVQWKGLSALAQKVQEQGEGESGGGGSKEEASQIVEERKARDGNPILVLHRNEREYVMNSRFRPEEEARKYALQFENIKDYSVVVLFGFGNGVFARELLHYGSEKVRYVFYEPSAESFLFCLTHYDLSDLILDERFWLYVEGINERAMAGTLPAIITWESIPLTDIKVLPKYDEAFPEAYHRFVVSVRDVVARAEMTMNTYVEFGHILMHNAVLNTRFLFYGTSTTAFHGVFPAELSAVLVSAGPSLSNNLSVLKDAKGKAFVLCVDTALRRLLGEGIVPDAVVTVDPRKWAAYQEAYKPYYKDMMLVTTSRGNTSLIGAAESYRNIFSEGEDHINDRFYQEAGQPLEVLDTGGSVANTALSMLVEWGFPRIIFVGQDLALTGNRRYSDSQEDAEQASIAKGFTIFDTEAYDGGTVHTREDYFTYLKWFEAFIQAHPDVDFINSTQGGARIHGARNLPLAEALERYANEPCDIRSIVDRVPRAYDGKDREQLEQELRDLPAAARRYMRLFKEGQSLCERAATLVKRSAYSQKELSALSKRMRALEKIIETEPECYAIIARAYEVEHRIKRDFMVNKSCDSEAAGYEMMAKLYEAYRDAARDMYECAQEMVGLLDQQGWR